MRPRACRGRHACANALMVLPRLQVCLWYRKQKGCGMMTPMTSKGIKVPRILRGSLVTLRRRCGKPSCYCADGDQRHEAPALSYSDHGRTRMVMLAETDVAAVAAALERYRVAKTELEEQAGAGLAVLTQRVAAERATRARVR